MSADKQSRCDLCAYYDYDDDMEMYVCGVNMDEDEYARFCSTRHAECPYFSLYDEYKTVKKQN